MVVWTILDHFGPFWSSTLSDSTAVTPYLRTLGPLHEDLVTKVCVCKDVSIQTLSEAPQKLGNLISGRPNVSDSLPDCHAHRKALQSHSFHGTHSIFQKKKEDFDQTSEDFKTDFCPKFVRFKTFQGHCKSPKAKISNRSWPRCRHAKGGVPSSQNPQTWRPRKQKNPNIIRFCG